MIMSLFFERLAAILFIVISVGFITGNILSHWSMVASGSCAGYW